MSEIVEHFGSTDVSPNLSCVVMIKACLGHETLL